VVRPVVVADHVPCAEEPVMYTHSASHDDVPRRWAKNDSRGAGIHMLMEQPRLFFMHFWANGDAVTLAKGFRTALDHTNSAK